MTTSSTARFGHSPHIFFMRTFSDHPISLNLFYYFLLAATYYLSYVKWTKPPNKTTMSSTVQPTPLPRMSYDKHHLLRDYYFNANNEEQPELVKTPKATIRNICNTYLLARAVKQLSSTSFLNNDAHYFLDSNNTPQTKTKTNTNDTRTPQTTTHHIKRGYYDVNLSSTLEH